MKVRMEEVSGIDKIVQLNGSIVSAYCDLRSTHATDEKGGSTCTTGRK
jgi:hypothetical protein